MPSLRRHGGDHGADPAAAEEAQAALTEAGVRLVACTFVDLAGVTRIKGVPVERFADAVRHGVGMSYVSTVFTVDDQIASSPGFGSPTGDMRLRPDPNVVVVLDDAPGWAWGARQPGLAGSAADVGLSPRGAVGCRRPGRR